MNTKEIFMNQLSLEMCYISLIFFFFSLQYLYRTELLDSQEVHLVTPCQWLIVSFGFLIQRVAQHCQLVVIYHFSTVRKNRYQHESYLIYHFFPSVTLVRKKGIPVLTGRRNLVTSDILRGSEGQWLSGRVLVFQV